MRNHSLAGVFAIGAVVVLAACGSSSNTGGSIDGGSTVSGTGAGGAGTGSATGTGTATSTGAGTGGSCTTGTGAGGAGSSQACSDCLSTNCNSELTSCYGPGWKSGSFSGGGCSDFLNCTIACPCMDTACQQGCSSRITQACVTCSMAVLACDQSKCSAQCGSGTTGGTGGSAGAGGSGASGGGGGAGGAGGGASCADLQTCCNAAQFPAMFKATCDMLAMGGDDANCANALSAFRSSSYCP